MDNRQLDRVRGLLAKAESTDSDHEAQALFAKASELMAKYSIDKALLDATAPVPPKPIDKKTTITAAYGTVYSNLLFRLGKVYNVSVIRLGARKGVTVHMFGFDNDIERLEIMFNSIMIQMGQSARRVQGTYYHSVKAERRSYLMGYVSGVVDKIEAAERTVVAETSSESVGAELVLVGRQLAVQSAYDVAYPNRRQIKMTYTGSQYGTGYRDGQNANLSHGNTRTYARGALV